MCDTSFSTFKGIDFSIYASKKDLLELALANFAKIEYWFVFSVNHAYGSPDIRLPDIQRFGAT